MMEYKYLVTCNSIEELERLEQLLFGMEFESQQCISPFKIVCNEHEYLYELEKFGNKYYIVGK